MQGYFSKTKDLRLHPERAYLLLAHEQCPLPRQGTEKVHRRGQVKSLTASINKKTQRLEKWNASNSSVQVTEVKHNIALKILRENDFQFYVYWYIYID